ncbi:MAG TPA: FGGY family carbohydrate kinase [Methylomirabilota bacterium]|nr:FGGY family carbohydrate kinase [Methylomirabilota bacterium]
MWILALDVGTSSIRAIGYDALGRPLPGADARVSCEPTATPDGGSHLDPEELVAATASAIDRCVASPAGPPAAVGASVFCHSLLALNAEGRPLTGVMTWTDTRSAGAAKALRARLDGPAVHARTGAPLHSTFFPAKLTWLREAKPDVFARAATWCGFAEYLLLRLTGRLRASGALAGAATRRRRWLASRSPQPRRRSSAPWSKPSHIASRRSTTGSRRWRRRTTRSSPRAARSGTPASSHRSWPTRWGCPLRCARAQRLRAAARRSWPWVRSAARAPSPEPSGSQVRPDPRRRDTHAAARARQGRLYESVVGPRVS